MTQSHSAWVDHKRKRWMRPDAHLWIRPDAWRFMPPGAPRYFGKDAVRYFWPEAGDEAAPAPARTIEQELAAEREALARLRSELAALHAELRFRRLLRDGKANFNPNQPRVPAAIPTAGNGRAREELQRACASRSLTNRASVTERCSRLRWKWPKER